MDLLDQDIEHIKLKILFLYKLNDYPQCLKEITNSFQSLDQHYKTIGLCCLLIDKSIDKMYIKEFVTQLKKDDMYDLVDAFNFFEKKTKYHRNSSLIDTFCRILIFSSDPRTVNYILTALYKISGLNRPQLSKLAYENGLFHLCNEILSDHFSEVKSNYNLLILKAKVMYKLGNYYEGQKYAACAAALSDSEEPARLSLLCSIEESLGASEMFLKACESEAIEQAVVHLNEAKNSLI